MSDKVLQCDVLIVGGGPAGLSVASSLDDGFSSIVVHQDAEIGKPVRTSGGSWVKDLEELGIPPKYYNVINHMDLYSDNHHAELKVSSDIGAILDITGLYKYLASLSDEKNRKLLLGSKFVTTKKGSDGRYVSTVRNRKSGEIKIKSSYIVDASGWPCSVLVDQGLGKKPEKLGLGTEYEYDLGDNDPKRTVLFVGSAAPTGYGWAFPTGDNKIRIGIGVLSGTADKSPKELLDAFIASDELAKYNISVDKANHVMGGIIPMIAYDKALVFDKIIRVGDSANFATPTVLEGIRVCIKYGRVLGEALSQTLASNDQKYLRKYETTCNKALSRDYKIGFLVSNRTRGYSPKDWDKSVRRAKRLSEKDFIGFLRNEFSVKTILSAVYKSISTKLFD